MTAITSNALGAVLVQPLPTRVTAFRPVSRSVRTPVVAQASSAQNQVQLVTVALQLCPGPLAQLEIGSYSDHADFGR